MAHQITDYSAYIYRNKGELFNLRLDRTFYVVRHLIDAEFPESHSISAFGNTHYQSFDPVYLVDILIFAIEAMARNGYAQLKNGEWIECSK